MRRAILVSLISLFLLSIPALAAGVDVPVPDVPSGAGEALTDVLNFLNNLLRTVFIVSGVGLALVCAYHGYRIATAKDSRQREEAVQGIGHTVLGGILIFGGGFVVRLILSLLAR